MNEQSQWKKDLHWHRNWASMHTLNVLLVSVSQSVHTYICTVLTLSLIATNQNIDELLLACVDGAFKILRPSEKSRDFSMGHHYSWGRTTKDSAKSDKEIIQEMRELHQSAKLTAKTVPYVNVPGKTRYEWRMKGESNKTQQDPEQL